VLYFLFVGKNKWKWQPVLTFSRTICLSTLFRIENGQFSGVLVTLENYCIVNSMSLYTKLLFENELILFLKFCPSCCDSCKTSSLGVL